MNNIFHYINSRYLFQGLLLLVWLLPGQMANAISPGAAVALPPNWTIDPLNFEFNMSMVIQVKYNGAASNAAGNMVGAFVGNELRGVGTPVTAGSSTYFFTTIYSNSFVGETVYFKVYYAPDDKVYATANTVTFRHHLSLGSFGAPFMVDVNPNQDFPPQIAPIPPDTTLQGIPFASVDLNTYLVSLDGDPVTWSVTGSANLNVALVNNVLTVTPVAPLWTGTDSVRVIVKENTVNQLADTTYALFTVLTDYGPPVWQTVPNQTIIQGSTFTSFDLDNYLTFNGPCRRFNYDVTPFSGTVTDPAWPTVPPDTNPMNITARVLFANELLSGSGAKLAAFVNGNLAGTATPTGSGNNITYKLQLANVGTGAILFRFYDATNQYLYEKTSALNFTAGASVGTVSTPYVVQLSPIIPVIAADGIVQMNIIDPAWLGTFSVDFIVWDCLLPTLRRDTTKATFTIVPNVRPTIISPPTVNFEENACAQLYDAQSSDPNNSEGAGLTYSLSGGADMAKFSINPQTGILSWAVGFTPNFENPQDADANNQYEVSIQVTNLANQSDILALVVTVTNQQPEPFVASINGGTPLICTLANVNLQAAGGMSYQWSNGSAQSSILVTTAGTYTVTATSSGGCTSTASVVVAPTPKITAAGSATPICQGAPVQLSSTPTGGTAPYATFAWTGQNSFVSGLEDPAAFSATPSAAGTYTVTLTDGAGCTASGTATISVSANTAPTITAGSNGSVCVGASIVLTSTPSGGSGIGYTYLWAGPPNYAATGQNPTPFTAVAGNSGVYTVMVTDNAGCTGVSSTTVQVWTQPTVVASSNSPVSVGANILLNATPSGGSGAGYTFQWSGPNGFFAAQAQPVGFTAALAAIGVYAVTVTDSNGCTGTATTTVSVVACPTITAAQVGSPCLGGLITLSATPAGGATPYATFAWAGPNNFSSILEDPLPFAGVQAATGTYTVTVTDALGCTATATTTVVVNASPAITASNNGPMCQGATVVLTSMPSGGSGVFSGFQWSGPDGFSSGIEDPASFTGTPANSGVYTVKVTDNKGCTATNTTTLVVNPRPVIGLTGNSPLCVGAKYNLNTSPGGGAAPYSFAWTGPNSFNPTVEDPTPFAVTTLSAGTYSVTVTNSAGCSNTASTTLTVSNLTAPTITTSSNNPVCAGQNLALSSTPNGGSGTYTAFAWAGPNNYASTQEDPSPFYVLVNATGTYTVTVTDSQNCKGTSSVSITVSSASINPTSNSPICPGGTIVLNAGGNGQLYSWTGPNGFSSASSNPSIPLATIAASGTYYVTVNDNGCLGIGSVIVDVSDVTPPSITCPGSLTINTSQACSTPVGSYNAVSVSDNCAANPAVTQSPIATTVITGHNTAQTITLTANDGNGNTATCTFVVTLKDVIPPSITCPVAPTVNADTNCSASIGIFNAATVSDNCTANPTVTQSPVATTVITGHNTTQTVTLTANDGNGNTSTCTFVVTLKDVTPPSLTCPVAQTVNAGPTCSAPIGAYNAVSVSDNCTANPAVVQSPVATTVITGHNTTQTITLTANDGNGNTATCTFVVTLKDVTPPSVTCPPSRNVNADANCAAPIGAYDAVAVSDNCAANPTVAQSPAATTVIVGHNTTQIVTLTANDGNGNTATCTFVVTLKDVTPPYITCPSPQNANAGPTCTATVTYTTPVGTDNCTNPITTQTSGLGSGGAFTLGLTTNTFLVTDAGGNTATCSFSVTVVDITPPSIICPANATVPAGPTCTATSPYIAPIGTDNCANPITTQTSGLAPSGTFALGATTNVFLVTDGAGNTATCSFTITVVDVTPPSITCPSNMIRPTDLNLCSAVVTYGTPIYSDNCSGGGVTHLNGGISGSTFPKGTSTVFWLATDGVGLTQTCSFTITVNDAQAPNITCPANLVRSNDIGQCIASVAYPTPTASDNCSLPTGQPQWISGGTTPVASGLNSVATFQKGITIVTWRVTDGVGLTKTCTFRVTVNDTEIPNMTCPPTMVLYTPPTACSAVGTYTNPTFTDNCPPSTGTSTRILGLASGSIFPLGNSNVVFQAADASGNTRRCTMVVTVIDNQPPVITCAPSVVVLGSGSPCGAQVIYTNTTASDNCAITPLVPTLVGGLASGSQFPAGVTTNTFRAVAPNGQSSECSFTVTVSCDGLQNMGAETRGTDTDVPHSNSLDLKLTPNPALSTVTVSIEGVGAGGGTLLVFDAVGRLVLRQVVAENQRTAVFQVDGSAFTPGLYRVNLRTETGMVTKTLVVVK